MNNWRLLLLAVVAVLQPSGSLTEPNLIDGRQERCDYRSNFFTQHTTLYGTSRKTNPEGHHQSTRATEGGREEQRQEGRYDPITRSSRTLERAERRISPESAVRFIEASRFAKNQDRLQPISFRARKTRQTREDDRQITRDGDGLDSRHMRMSRDYRTDRRDPLDARDARLARNSADPRRVATNRETMATLNRGRVARDVSFRTARMQLDTYRETRLDRKRTNDNGRFQYVDLTSRVESQKSHGSYVVAISERVEERRQREFKDSSNRITIIRPDSLETISAESRRDAVERVDRIRRETRENNNERSDRRRLSRERSALRRESRLSSFTEQRQARKSRMFNEQQQSERIVRNNHRVEERRHISRNMVRASSDSTTERRQESRVSRVIEATSRNKRLIRSEEREYEYRQPSTRSLGRSSVLRLSDITRSIQREYDSRNPAQLPERNVRDERDTKYRRDVRNVEDERREQRGESRMSRDRTISTLRESRDAAERRQESRRYATLTRFEVNAYSERESKTRDDVRANLRYEDNRQERQDHAASREQNLRHAARDSERKADRDLSRTSRFDARPSSDKRTPRIREDTKSERLNVRRGSQHETMKEKTLVLQRMTRDVSTRKFDTLKASGNAETSARLQRTRSLDSVEDKRREMRQRDENQASRYSSSFSRLSRKWKDDDARDVVSRNRREVSTGERFEVSQQQERRMESVSLRRQTRDGLAARAAERTSRDVAPRDGKTKIRSERVPRSRDDRRTNEREVRDIRSMESRESRTNAETSARFQRSSSLDSIGDERREMRQSSRASLYSDMNIRSETLWRSRDDRRTNERKVRDIRSVESCKSRTTEREFQAERPNIGMERTRRTQLTTEAEPRAAGSVTSGDGRTRANTRRETTETRFRNFAATIREIDSSDETADSQNMTWRVVLCTVHGAYLCGLLLQMLTEKPNKGKPRNFSWWARASKELVKVD